ncbi:MAG: aminopeptidase P N-terminal domain-containing protein [Gemmatimonadota bacterium]
MRRSLHLLLLLATAACAGAPNPSAQPAGSAGYELPPLPEPAPIGAAEYAARRSALLDQVGDGVLVVFGGPLPAFDYLPFNQNPDFRYLTGIMEPAAGYVAVKRGGRVVETLYVQDRDPAREVWEGGRLGQSGAQQRTGLAARSSQELYTTLDSLARVHAVFHTPVLPSLDASPGANLAHAQQVLTRLREKHPSLEVKSVQGDIRRLRGAKSDAELDRIRRAVYISALAHREAMRSAHAGMNEFEIRALIEYIFRRNGAEGPAYGSIVGSGPNSTTLHYQTSDRFMDNGEMLLIDAAASYAGYAADVTRSFPVDGTFTADQRAIYEIVLAAQKAAESQIRPGATWNALNEAANEELRNGLTRLGLIDGPAAEYDCGTSRCPQYRMFYMHGLGHGVGLAVHDPDISQTPSGFGPGSAVTIEPGIYIRADAFDHLSDTPGNRAMIERLRPALERYRDIGVRIEDVFVYDSRGIERASAAAPREIADIEALMSETGLDAASRSADMVEWFRQNPGR